ncbi:MAG: hypothetical protein RIT04_314 [Candidatus Parcubacteria bacterium]
MLTLLLSIILGVSPAQADTTNDMEFQAAMAATGLTVPGKATPKQYGYSLSGSLGIGYTSGINESDLEDTLHVGPMSIYAGLTLRAFYHKWDAQVTPGFSIGSWKNHNYIDAASIGYAVSEKTQIRAGLVLTADGMSMSVPRGNLTSTNWQTTGQGVYTQNPNSNPTLMNSQTPVRRSRLGVSASTGIGDLEKLTLNGDITVSGGDGSDYWSNMNGVTIGLGASYAATKRISFSLGGSYDPTAGEAFGSAGVNYQLGPSTTLNINGYAGGDQCGIGATVNYQLCERVGLHGGFNGNSDGGTSFSVGLGWAIAKRTSFSIDYIRNNGSRVPSYNIENSSGLSIRENVWAASLSWGFDFPWH